jgi:prophage DNA circulation protein
MSTAAEIVLNEAKAKLASFNIANGVPSLSELRLLVAAQKQVLADLREKQAELHTDLEKKLLAPLEYQESALERPNESVPRPMDYIHMVENAFQDLVAEGAKPATAITPSSSAVAPSTPTVATEINNLKNMTSSAEAAKVLGDINAVLTSTGIAGPEFKEKVLAQDTKEGVALAKKVVVAVAHAMDVAKNWGTHSAQIGKVGLVNNLNEYLIPIHDFISKMPAVSIPYKDRPRQ